jgi:metal-responsive CopG/Arc/MetJ family transcriptional regulator
MESIMAKKQESKKKHTAVYLPQELLRRLGQYQLDKTGAFRGRNEIIIQAIDAFLKKEKY